MDPDLVPDADVVVAEAPTRARSGEQVRVTAQQRQAQTEHVAGGRCVGSRGGRHVIRAQAGDGFGQALTELAAEGRPRPATRSFWEILLWRSVATSEDWDEPT